MTRPDDSTLDADQLRAVEERAHNLLDRASAWGRFPTPIEDIVVAAKLRIAPSGAFDPSRILSYLRDKTVDAARRIKSALSKCSAFTTPTNMLSTLMERWPS